MTADEGRIMQEHFGFWAAVIGDRKAVAYGPVMDPKGTYGIAVVAATDLEAAHAVVRGDPAIRSSGGFSFELHPMPDAIVWT